MALHPDGMAPRIINHAQWRGHLLERLARQAALTGDPSLARLHEELRGYPTPEDDAAPGGDHGGPDIAVPLRLRSAHGELAFLSTVTTFGTAVDITVAELAIESFLPADAATAAALSASVR